MGCNAREINRSIISFRLHGICALIAGKIWIIGTGQNERARIVDPCEKLLIFKIVTEVQMGTINLH